MRFDGDSVHDLRRLASLLGTVKSFEEEVAVCLKAAAELVQLKHELEYEKFQRRHDAGLPQNPEKIDIDITELLSRKYKDV